MDQPPDLLPLAPSPPPLLLPPPDRPRRSRWLGGIVAVLALLALGALAWYLTHRPAASPGGFGPAAAASGASGAAARPVGAPGGRGGRFGAASTVGIAAAKRADLPVYIDALGTVLAAVTTTVRPQVSGVITRIAYTEGQMVKKGQLLATIDPRSFEIALQQAIGARMRDEATLQSNKVQLQRYQTLLSQDSIARQDVDTLAATVKQLEGTIVIDRANESTARLNLSYCRIVAPIDGRVGLRPIDQGNYIAAGDTNGVAVITQVEPINVEFAVPQDLIPQIRSRVASGAKLAVTAFDRTRTVKLDEGTFSTLDNQIDTQTGTVKAKARFANTARQLFPNQFVNVRLLLQVDQGAIVIPVTAIRTGPNGDFVYVLNDDRTVSVRPVTRGIATTNLVAIDKGLEAGEQVVTEGGDRLKDGARVQLAADLPPAGASAAARAHGARRGASAAEGAASGHRRRSLDGIPAAASAPAS
ncbi:MAG TPA: efflux RND transporter periplasmic adaptor subunit [Caldimonas sp.]|nr:efflux RND transporter periplasmic adaptor subunit [Caldimonas sp.]